MSVCVCVCECVYACVCVFVYVLGKDRNFKYQPKVNKVLFFVLCQYQPVYQVCSIQGFLMQLVDHSLKQNDMFFNCFFIKHEAFINIQKNAKPPKQKYISTLNKYKDW